MLGFCFRPSLLGSVVTFAGVALFASLMLWQLDRAEQKRNLQAVMEARVAEAPVEYLGQVIELEVDRFRTVTLEGVFLNDLMLLLDNVTRAGKPGYKVIVPFRLSDSGSLVLIDRGWIAAPRERDKLPTVTAVNGEQVLTGIIDQVRSAPVIGGERAVVDRQIRWSWLDMELLRERTGMSLPSFVIAVDTGNDGELISESVAYDAKVGMHIGYAIQWGAFAFIALGVFIAVSLKKRSDLPV